MSSITAGTTSTTTLVHSGDTTGSLVFKTNDTGSGGTTAVTIDTSQNVGIGTSSPLAILDVASSSNPAVRIRNTSTGGAGIWFGNSTSGTTTSDGANVGIDSSQQLNLWNYENTATLFATNNTERMRIDSSGNLLVGTTTAYAKTTILGSGTTSGGTALSVRDSGATDLFYVRNDGLIVTGARTTSPYNNTTASAANLNVDSGGTLSRSTSSLKYKKNVQNATHGLADVLKLRSVTYQGKAEQDVGKTFGGLIAEEVHDAGLTEFVQYADDGTPDALAYGNMVSLCVKAIQELKAINDQQAETINALTARLVALESRGTV